MESIRINCVTNWSRITTALAPYLKTKSITNDEWVVVPRDFASMLYTLEGIANSCSVQDQGKAKDYLAQLKQYL